MPMPSSRRRAALLLLGSLTAPVEAGERPALRPGELDFAARPAWQERLDRIARHGLPLASLRDTRDGKLVIGMHPDGYFGVFLVPSTK
jgi:hypothetical protein